MSEEKGTTEKPMLDEKTKLLNLMRFWLFGTFVIVFAAITAYSYVALLGLATPLQAVMAGWPVWVITGVLCVLIYVGYSFYLKRKT